ncbi:CDGSH iron-sulfur domain-containing protein [Prescottella agglutinans]|uniref:CDGSH iron-sulfur domain-containing protein n=1 Tax=Prescottella agglutinans TaxID=1644129 RepID=A0A438BEN4_9NOCA|nr:CDGSH iron-sulfur domain-containing protein [Prescottella agglutinans]RVW09145.1 CDGSH iron-sulfur domain-containing protein [Prescottella agglutinans]
MTSADEDVTISVCPDGPLLVRGSVAVVDGAGRQISSRPRICALCRCGRTARPPFCDGTHKRRRRTDRRIDIGPPKNEGSD